jgi:metal-responsive CopG/Arc/MetJ family transcriptional regulator
MRKTTIYFPEELKIKIEAVSKMEHRPEAEIIREAVSIYLEERRNRRLPRSFGMVADGSFDPAEDERYLAEHWKPDW